MATGGEVKARFDPEKKSMMNMVLGRNDENITMGFVILPLLAVYQLICFDSTGLAWAE